VNSFQVAHLDRLDIDQALLMPEADLRKLPIPRTDPQGDGLGSVK
jgi:hypothetical protein